MGIQYSKGDVKIMKLIFSIPNSDEKFQLVNMSKKNKNIQIGLHHLPTPTLM